MVERALTYFSLAQIADSGQCFRMKQIEEGHFSLIAHGKVLEASEHEGVFRFACDEREFKTRWEAYFDLDTDYEAMAARVPECDAFLTRAVDYGRGIHILRQEPWETLITFIISQRKNIPAIRGAVESLSAAYGEPLGEGYYAFPTADRLACVTQDELRAHALGYRARYIWAAAQMVAAGTLDLEALACLPDDELLAALQAVPGVGIKVAGCVQLFGYHRLGAFPRDVWINRVVEDEYNGNFPLALYEGCAGVVQQYMFFYARAPKLPAEQRRITTK